MAKSFLDKLRDQAEEDQAPDAGFDSLISSLHSFTSPKKRKRRVLEEVKPFNSGHGSNVEKHVSILAGGFTQENKENWLKRTPVKSAEQFRVSKCDTPKSSVTPTKRKLSGLRLRDASPNSLEKKRENDASPNYKIKQFLKSPAARRKRVSDVLQDAVMVYKSAGSGRIPALLTVLTPQHFSVSSSDISGAISGDKGLFLQSYALVKKMADEFESKSYTQPAGEMASTHTILEYSNLSPTVIYVSLKNLKDGSVEQCCLMKLNLSQDSIIAENLKVGSKVYIPEECDGKTYKYYWSLSV